MNRTILAAAAVMTVMIGSAADAQTVTKYYSRAKLGPATSSQSTPVTYSWTPGQWIGIAFGGVCQPSGTRKESRSYSCMGSDGSTASSSSSCTGSKPADETQFNACTVNFVCQNAYANNQGVSGTGQNFTAATQAEAFDTCIAKSKAAKSNSICTKTPASSTSWRFNDGSSISASSGSTAYSCAVQ